MPLKTSMFAGNNREEEMTCVESTLYSKVLSTESKRFFLDNFTFSLQIFLRYLPRWSKSLPESLDRPKTYLKLRRCKYLRK